MKVFTDAFCANKSYIQSLRHLFLITLAEYVTRRENILNWGWKIQVHTPVGRPRYRWENGIKLYLRGIVCEEVKWPDFCDYGYEPSGSIKGGTFLTGW